MEIVELENKKTWEEFISYYAPQSLFQAWNWGEAVGKIKNQKSKIKNLWRFGLYDNKTLVGIAQIIKVEAKKGTFLHIRHGPIFSSWQKKYVNSLFQYLKTLAKSEKAVFIRISPLIENSQNNKDFLKSLGFINAPIHALDGEYCWVLDLNKTEKELLSDMRKTTRYLIKQAEKLGVVIIKSRNKDDLQDFFKLYDQTAQRHQFVKHAGISEEFDEFISDDQILLFKGYYEKKLLSAALIVFYNDQAIYHHSASVDQKIPVNYFLQWEAIKEAKKRGKAIYNFWGVAPEKRERHPWRGLSLFKKGFGGRLVEYLHTQDLPLSFLYCTTYSFEWLRKIWKGY